MAELRVFISGKSRALIASGRRLGMDASKIIGVLRVPTQVALAA
jgi:hypothetical protein